MLKYCLWTVCTRDNKRPRPLHLSTVQPSSFLEPWGPKTAELWWHQLSQKTAASRGCVEGADEEEDGSIIKSMTESRATPEKA